MDERIISDHEHMISSLVNDIEHMESIACNGAGLVTCLEVATAENVALGTERSSPGFRGQQLVATAALIKSLGGGWFMPELSNTMYQQSPRWLEELGVDHIS